MALRYMERSRLKVSLSSIELKAYKNENTKHEKRNQAVLPGSRKTLPQNALLHSTVVRGRRDKLAGSRATRAQGKWNIRRASFLKSPYQPPP
jgi:hypothetical protein